MEPTTTYTVRPMTEEDKEAAYAIERMQYKRKYSPFGKCIEAIAEPLKLNSLVVEADGMVVAALYYNILDDQIGVFMINCHPAYGFEEPTAALLRHLKDVCVSSRLTQINMDVDENCLSHQLCLASQGLRATSISDHSKYGVNYRFTWVNPDHQAVARAQAATPPKEPSST